MFSPGYFPGSYFPRRYFPGGLIVTPVTGVAIKYFPPDFYAPSYFAGSYFPNGTTSLVAGVAADLLEAISTLIAATTSLSAVTSFSLDNAPPNRTGPYATIVNTGSSDYFKTSTSEWKNERLTLRVYSGDADIANTLGVALAVAVKSWGAIDYIDGFSLPLFETGRRKGEVKGKRAGDPGSFYFELTYSARCKRG